MRLPDESRSRAVLIGVSRYSSTTLQDLPAVMLNITDLRRVLVDPVRSTFSPNSCVPVVDPKNPNDLIDPIHEAARAAEDVLFVYIACHGLLLGDKNDLHLAVVDTDPTKSWTAASYEQIANVLRDSHATVKVVILDCCYSGRATRVALAGAPVVGSIGQVDVEGAYVLTSTSATRESFVDDDSQYTAFTAALLAVLTSSTPAGDPFYGSVSACRA